MCKFNAGYTTIAGPFSDLQDLPDLWISSLKTPGRLRLETPVVQSLEHLDDHFVDRDCPAVAVVRHDPILGRRPANELQAELLALSPTRPLICEPGFQLRVATAASSGASPVAVSIDPAKITATRKTLGSGTLQRVAVIDSGDLPGQADMVDFLGGAQPPPSPESADDQHGHGSSVAELIRALRPSADVEAVRIVDSGGVADSFDLFLALVYCLWPGTFDVVNVSLSQDVTGHCETWLGTTMVFLMDHCRQRGKGADTVLVAAAGNDPTMEAQYPALLPGAVVATATDWTGAAALYNSTTRAAGISGSVVQAYGGVANDPFGTWSDPSGATREMWGTSFAAAVVTASHLA